MFVTGSNVSGQLGLGADAPRVIDSPVRVPAPVEFKFATVGVHTTFAIDRDGNLWTAGNGSKAHFGIGEPKVSADQTGLDGIIYTEPQHSDHHSLNRAEQANER